MNGRRRTTILYTAIGMDLQLVVGKSLGYTLMKAL
jgi:hypothetical protein